MNNFVATHIAALGNSQDSPRTRVLVHNVRASEMPRFFLCDDVDGKTYTLPDQNLTPLPNDTTTKPALVVEPPTQAS